MTPRRKDYIIPAIVLFLFLAVMARVAGAHTAVSGWEYDPLCCNGNAHNGDCQRIPLRTVKPVEGGYRITIGPGDHRKATKQHTFFVKYGDEKKSGDSDYHLCLWPTENDARCFYAPDMGT